MQGFAPGGLTQCAPAEITDAAVSCMLAEDVGLFGFKPHVLMDVLAGKRAAVAPSLATFWRLISGDLSPLDLETAMQLVHKLFTTEVQPLCCHFRLSMMIHCAPHG